MLSDNVFQLLCCVQPPYDQEIIDFELYHDYENYTYLAISHLDQVVLKTVPYSHRDILT